ncbi:hypothetical protein [Infirmifilum sp. SLHALR2]|nr:MAG: hypothetical protein B7L53_01995 [Thermofilum sp. NZ13]
MKQKLVALGLIALLVSLMAVSQVQASEDSSVEALIANAKRLRGIAYEKFSYVASAINTTLYAPNISEIESLLLEADSYLNTSVQLYTSGNITGAKLYAIYSLNTYDTAIELIEKLAEKAGLELEVEAPQNRTEVNMSLHYNRSVALNKTALTLQLQVLKARLSGLESTLSKLNQSQYNLTYVYALIAYAKDILSQTEAQLSSGNITVAQLAANLAVVKKILGLINAELNRVSLHVTVIRAMKLGLLKKNETSFLNASLLNHTGPKLKEIRSRTRTGLNETAAVLKEVENEVRNMAKGLNDAVKQLKEKIKEKHGAEKEISAPPTFKPPKEKPLPPGLEKKLGENAGSEESGEQQTGPGKGPRGKGK